MTKTFFRLAALSSVIALAVPAFAQGNGVKTGRFRVSPAVHLEGWFDSNFYREDVLTEGPTQAGYLKLLPSIEAGNPEGGQVRLTAIVDLELRQYLDSIISEEQDRVAFHVGASAELGVDKPVTFQLNQDLRRQLEPGQGFRRAPVAGDNIDRIERGCDSPCSQTFWNNATRVGLPIAPGGGRLEIKPAYRFSLTSYEDFDATDWTEHMVSVLAAWKFFPKTAIFADANYGFLAYPESITGVESSNPLRARLGLRGLVTSKLSVDVGAGYGNSFSGSGDSFSSVVGSAALVFRFTETVRTKLGYQRDFAGSPISNYYGYHRGLADLQVQTGEFTFGGTASATFRGFSELGALPDNVQTNLAGENRADTVISAGVQAEYRPVEWMSLKAGYRLETLVTDFGARVGLLENFAAYERHQVFASFGLTL